MNKDQTDQESPTSSVPATALREKTKIGWCENRILEVSQFYCEKCEQYFCYEDDHDFRRPNFCPICGRENSKK